MSDRPVKHVVVTGGVVSGLGKGIVAASLGRLLTARGLRVVLGKMDPYLCVDSGLLAPAEHGEAYVLDSGVETDLDLGHYERFVGVDLPAAATITAGSVYLDVLTRERRGDYLGQTVQVVPHIVESLRDRMLALSAPDAGGATPDVVILELGGTVGDLESLAFLEAIRRYRIAVGKRNFALIHLALLPSISTSGEPKTKPAQHSVTELRSRGLNADIVALRSAQPAGDRIKNKISHLCDVEVEAVISVPDCPSLYEVPLALRGEGLDDVVCGLLDLPAAEPDLSSWVEMVERIRSPRQRLCVGVVGKYGHSDAYLSVVESLGHAGAELGVQVEVKLVSSDELTSSSAAAELSGIAALVIPGGFGSRGVEGKIAAAQWAREQQLPTLGICLGMQVMVIETARHLAGLEGAHSTELDPVTAHPVVSLMSEQLHREDLGGTMRLGSYPCHLVAGTVSAQSYGSDVTVVRERHRHRYEVTNAYRPVLEQAGLTVSGTSPDGLLVEMVEVERHPFFVGTQAHPEFRSRPDAAHPLFVSLLNAALSFQASSTSPAAPGDGSVPASA